MMSLPGRRLRETLAVLGAAAVFACGREPAPRPDTEVVVAEVNGASVTLQDLKGEIASLRGVTPSVAARSATRNEVSDALRRLVERTIVLQEGERLGIAVSDSEVDAEIERYRSGFPPGGLEKSLVQNGIDLSAWRGQLRRSLLYRKASEAIAGSHAAVSPAEVEVRFRRKGKEMARPERIHVRQIFFPSRDAALKARERLLAWKDPEAAAGGLPGGDGRPSTLDLGYLARADLPPDLAPELFSLKERGVSRVVARDESFSLFVVLKKEPAGAPTLADAAPAIREEILGVRREEAFRAWLAAAAGKASVKVQTALVDRFVEAGR